MVGYAFHFEKSIIDQEEEEGEEGEEEGAVTILGKRRERPREEEEAAAAAAVEGWAEVLVQSDFFGVCGEHKEERKSEENIYCVDCGRRMCSHCLGGGHGDHRLLQIRRYVYQDVVRVHDMHSLLDCSKVQSYTVNSAKVVLLKPRRQSKPLKSNPCGAACEICRRSISFPNRYCSISCLVSDAGGALAVGVSQGSPSEPPIPHQTADANPAVEECLWSRPASPHPSDAEGEDVCRTIPEPSKRRVRRKQAFPRRSPFM